MNKRISKTKWLEEQRFLDQLEERRLKKEQEEAFDGFECEDPVIRDFWDYYG